jgi:hypothetical protein
MSFLEQRFLRQFREDGDGYVVIRRGREVRFSPTEVAELLKEWRLLWRAPWLWTGWLMIGVIAPLWIASYGYTAGALTFAVIAVLFMVVVLTPSWQKPREVAESRLPFEPDMPQPPVPPSWWQLGIFGAVSLMYGFQLVRGGGAPSTVTFFALWSGFFVIQVWQTVRYKQGKWNVGQRDPVHVLLLAVTAVAVATATALNPERETFDVVIAGLFVAMLTGASAIALWKYFRPSPHAA